MTRNARSIVFGAAYALIVIALLIAVWAIAAKIIDVDYVLPTVGETFGELVSAVTGENKRRFWSALGGTMLRSTIGFGISLLLFFATFYLSTAFDGFRRAVEPLISALRSIPAVAVTLVLALSVGGYGTPLVLGVLVIYPIMYSSALARVATVPVELKEVCRLLGAGRIAAFKALWLPCLAGGLPESLSSAFSYNIKAVIGAEILAQTANSLGMLMNLAKQLYQTSMLIAFVLAAVIVAVTAEILLRGLLKAALGRFAE